MRMRLKAVAIVLALCAGLAACANDRGSNETIGTIAGGVLGAVVGSQFGSGTGQVAATAAGTLLGAWVGGSVGRSLDADDRKEAALNDQQALDTNADGETSSWSNPDSGASGSMTPVDSFQTAGGDCRAYEKMVRVDGEIEKTTGTACRNDDGLWVEAD